MDTAVLQSSSSVSASSPTFYLIVGRAGRCMCFPFEDLSKESLHGFMPFDDPQIWSLADCVKNLDLGNSKARQVVVVLRGKGELEILDVTKEYEGSASTSASTSWPGVLEMDNSFSESYKQCSVGESVNSNELLAVLQGNSHPAAVEIDLSKWSTVWARTESQGYQLMFQFVNWELNGIFNFPQDKQRSYLCWLFTLCDHLQALYALLHPNKPPIKLSKQYILDYIPIDGMIGERFGYELTKAYRWVEANYLVLEDDYLHFDDYGTRGTKQPIKDGHQKLRISGVTQLQGFEQAGIERALLHRPLAGTIRVRPEEIFRISKDPYFSFVIEDNDDDYGLLEEVGGNYHTIVLSGMISSQFTHPKFPEDLYHAKDPDFMTETGRFFLKKDSSVLLDEINALSHVVYPEKVYLEP